MKRIILIILAGGLVLTVAAGLFLTKRKPDTTTLPEQELNEIKNQPQEIQEEKQVSVPLPTEEDIIRVFFELINEKRIPEAIDMMMPSLVGDESAKQSWGVQFNSLENIVVKKVEPSLKEEWTARRETFKVTVNLEVAKEAASAPIPYYGWENGDNLRWVTLEKNEKNLWKISAIATGP